MGLGQNLALGVGVVTLGTVYVLLHEARRKAKKRAAAERDQPIAKELLLQILHKAAEHSKSVIQRIRVEVGKIKESRNLSDEQASMLFQQNFEHSLEQLIGAIRGQYGVSEKAMDASFKLHQADPQVQAAIQGMRLSAELATSHAQKAADALGVLPPSEARDALLHLCFMVLNRSA